MTIFDVADLAMPPAAKINGPSGRDADRLASRCGRQPWEVALLLYPGISLLEVANFCLLFTGFARLHLVSDTLSPVVSDLGAAIRPTAAYHDCPTDLDVLVIPAAPAGEKARSMDGLCFLADRILRARRVLPLDMTQLDFACRRRAIETELYL